MNLLSYVDHTLLRADAKEEEVLTYCKEAIRYGFRSVVVNSANVPLVTKALEGYAINTAAVVGFPLGAMLTHVKAIETSLCVKLGANEIDMVINIGALKDGRYQEVEADVRAVVMSAGDALVKVIIETCLLSDEEIVMACKISERAGARYVKTSTGFSSAGATTTDVALMKASVSDKVKVKASGGIRNKEDALAMIEAGADRLGIGDGKVLLD